MRTVNYLGLDYGTKRVGVSICHGDVGVALPMDAIVAAADGEKIEKICAVVAKNSISAIAIGYPINMDGSAGRKAAEVDEFIEKLERALPSGVRIFRSDERLTSEQADCAGRADGSRQSAAKKRKRRKSGATDSIAAAIILNDFLSETVRNGVAGCNCDTAGGG
jgi:putative Holliday junction resolvase